MSRPHLLDVALVHLAIQLQIQLVAVRLGAGGVAHRAAAERQLARLGCRVVGDAAAGAQGGCTGTGWVHAVGWGGAT